MFEKKFVLKSIRDCFDRYNTVATKDYHPTVIATARAREVGEITIYVEFLFETDEISINTYDLFCGLINRMYYKAIV